MNLRAVGMSLVVSACGLTGCASGGGEATLPVRIFSSPYAGVDWAADARVLAQHHDHPGRSTARLAAYDAAGYNVVGLQDYSGAPKLPYALKTRLWTPEAVLPGDFLASMKNIRFFIPNAEEVGLSTHHMTSPFMTQYIEYAGEGVAPTQPYQYSTAQQLIDLIARNGGVPLLAHPWNAQRDYTSLDGFFGIEIYSAFAEARQQNGANFLAAISEADPHEVEAAKDARNDALLTLWDQLLAGNQQVLGIAVNDHFGPDSAPDAADARVRDSGKIVVLARSMSYDDYKDAVKRRAVLAIKDFGEVKGRYPRIHSISVEKTSILIDTDDTVRWIANGRDLGSANPLDFAAIPAGSTYLRAEVSNADGSVVYTQAFTLRPIGDTNGDRRVDARDQSLCATLATAQTPDPVQVAACEAAPPPTAAP